MNYDKKEDLRITRTKKHLTNALFELLKKKSIEKITVMEICEKAMVHRATFYKYFQDKYDLFEFLLYKLKEDIFSESLNAPHKTSKEKYLAIVNDALCFIEDNRSFLLSAIQNNISESLLLVLNDTFERAIQELLQQDKQIKSLKVPLQILSPFLAGGFTSMAVWWLTHKNSCTKEELKTYISKLLNENIYFG